MKTSRGTVLLVVFLGLTVLIVSPFACHSLEDSRLRAERERVMELVVVGQPMDAAQRLLREHGYELFYDTPIFPTNARDYMQQLVIIGDAKPSFLDKYYYVTTGGANPWRKESPYVAIDADVNGVTLRLH